MIRTVLIDDETRLLSSLQTMLKRNCPQLDVVAACRSADEALIKIKETDPELVFLDIAMPGKDGFALLEEIGDIRFRIIFVSAHDEYSLRAFKFSTVDYLLNTPTACDENTRAGEHLDDVRKSCKFVDDAAAESTDEGCVLQEF